MSRIFILIPAFNVARFLSKTIQSVIDQTFQDWELLVLDDCSTDDTYTIAKGWELTDGRIRVLRNEENLGMLSNWNKGISLCPHPFFVKLDADDVWHPRMLEKAMGVLQAHDEVGLVFSRYVNINESGEIIPGTDDALPDFCRNTPISCLPLVQKGPDKMLAYPILRQGLSVMRKEVFDKVGVYRYLITKETQAATDTEFYFRVGAHYKIYCIDEVMYQYRVHKESISATDHKKFLSDQKLYEIKYCIINYYAEQGLLEKRMVKKFLKEVKIRYSFSRAAQLRAQGKRSDHAKLFLTQFIKYPLASTSFYLTRLFEKYKL
jgi:glycosyltransferase involved in cell wall biosynthesis